MRNPLNLTAVLTMAISALANAQDAGSEALTRAGLDPAHYEIGATHLLSVRSPWTEEARVAFAGVDVYIIDGNLARLGPGRDEVLPVPRAQLLWNPDAQSGFVIDCLVTGDAQSFVASRFEGERARENRRDMPVTRDGDRLAFFMEQGTGGNVYLHSVEMGWAFKECAIVAVRER